MIRDAFDRDSVGRYVEAIRPLLGSDALADSVARAAEQVSGEGDARTKINAALPPIDAAEASSGGGQGGAVPYLSREPAVSLVQSAVEVALRQRRLGAPAPGTPGIRARLRGLWNKIVLLVIGLLHPGSFTPDDPDWVIKIAESMLDHLAMGNHPFNAKPAEHEISDSARLVIVGDWGTGLPRAQAVARLMAGEIAGGLGQGREVHVIHLGDVYYSGLPVEVEKHVLDYWPVTPAQAKAGVTSWSLNGNHDMYSGGFGYYETLLGDPRFAAQHSPDGAATSFFRLTAPSWDFVGLDTSWDPDVLSKGASAVLADPQAEFVASVAKASDRKLVLLSHHQLDSAYDKEDIGPVLTAKLGPVLESGRVTSWWWGHEHRCMALEPVQRVQFPRCLGHGGVPVIQAHAPDAPVPSPGSWEARGFLDIDGEHWGLFGFAVLDLASDQIQVRYLDEKGAIIRTETIK
jgi:hypothetical protein